MNAVRHKSHMRPHITISASNIYAHVLWFVFYVAEKSRHSLKLTLNQYPAIHANDRNGAFV